MANVSPRRRTYSRKSSAWRRGALGAESRGCCNCGCDEPRSSSSEATSARRLPEFDALADAYVRTEGAATPNALECRRQAAYCRAELGQATAALKQFREVLEQVRANDGDASSTALELRRNIGALLLSEGDTSAAAEVLEPLYQDLCVLYGQDHEDSQEVNAMLARLRLG